MNFNKLKSILPKKSVLKKNKWVLVILALVILVGLYWYSKKSQENFEKYAAGYTNLTADNNIALNRDLYTEKTQLINILDLKNTDNSLKLYYYIQEAKDTYVKGLTEGCTLNQKWLDEQQHGDVTKGAINTSYFNDFFLGKKSDDEGNTSWVLGDEGMFNTNQDNSNTKSKCQGYNQYFNGLKDLYIRELKQLEVDNIDTTEFSETDFLTNTMNETITVFVAGGCDASKQFLTTIWTKDLTDYLLETYPSISLNVEKCEDLTEDIDGRINESMCNLSGLFSTPTTTSPLGYPLIQHSVLLETQNLETGKNALIQHNFDPTKRYDLTETDGSYKEDAYEEVDPSTNNPKTIYSAKKIKEWISRLIY